VRFSLEVMKPGLDASKRRQVDHDSPTIHTVYSL
jgi:hypothetical protein